MSLHKNKFLITPAILLCLMVGLLSAGENRPLLHPLFSDHAVLQRGKPLTLWGWAKPGTQVTVKLSGVSAANAESVATADSDGRWQAQLGPFPACATPCTLSVGSDVATAEAKDLLIGDVWLCSGQSNMEMTVKGCKNAEQEIKSATFPAIRHLTITKAQEFAPVALPKGVWQVCSPETVAGFTAAGYFFGRELHRSLQAPIGLVHSSWGGTSAESWTSLEVLAGLPEHVQTATNFTALAAAYREQKKRTGKEYPQLIAAWYEANDPGSKPAANGKIALWANPADEETGWTPVKIPAAAGKMLLLPEHWLGTVWLRCRVNLTEADAGKPCQLALGGNDGWETTFVNGRQVGAAEHIQGAPHVYPVPAGVTKASVNLIAIRLLEQNAKAVIGGAGEYQLRIAGVPTALGDWTLRTGVDLAQAAPLPVNIRGIGPSVLSNGMIAPLIPMAFTGVIWYQGETDVGLPFRYDTLLQAMIGDWRSRFGQGDFPFYIVQLANYMEESKYAGDSSWAELRDAQARVASTVPNCGLAVAIDIGDAKNIHPTNKQEVGRRLALCALAGVYGKKDVVASGPVFHSLAVESSAIRVSFDHLGGGLVTHDAAAVKGFSIAGADHKWQWAEARIDGDNVVVSSAAVPKPVAVRYGWMHNPGDNLENKVGLPAVPFRSDDWPGYLETLLRQRSAGH